MWMPFKPLRSVEGSSDGRARKRRLPRKAEVVGTIGIEMRMLVCVNAMIGECKWA